MIHRPADGSADVYRQSGLLTGQAFNVDRQGNYYVAGRTSWNDGDGVNPPAVHIFGRITEGSIEIAELRVLSRCDGGWILDAADRPNAHDTLGNVAVDDDGMAWSYNYGASFGHHYEAPPPDRMLVAERTRNACLL